MGIFKNKKTLIIAEIIIFCILAFLVGSAQTVSPFHEDLNLIDEGQFAAWANLMLHGKMMFRDMYIVYGPLFVYPIYLLFKIFSPTAFMVRVFLNFGSIVGIIILNLIMLDLKIKRFGRYLLNFLMILLPILTLRQAIGWISIYLLILIITKKNLFYSFLTGISISATFLISPELGIIVGAFTLLYYVFLLISDLNGIRILKSFFVWIVGLFIPLIIFSLWSYKEGWFLSYLVNTKSVLVDFSGINVPNGQNIPDIFALLPTKFSIFGWLKFLFSKEIYVYYTIIIHIFLLIYLTVRRILNLKLEDDKIIFIILMYGISFLYLYIGRPDFGHLFFGLSPVLLILIYYFDKNIKMATKLPNLAVSLIILLYFLRLIYVNHPQIQKIIDIPSAIVSKPVNPEFVGPILISNSQKNFFLDLQGYMNKNSNKNDNIFIFTDEPMLYLILNRNNATRYVLPYAANTISMRLDLINSLIVNKPKFILIDNKAWAVDGINNEVRLPEVIKYIKSNYKEVENVDGISIFK